MKLPTNILLKEVMHGSGAKGMSIYVYEDDQDIGVVKRVKRENSRSAFVGQFMFKWLPDKEFASYKDLVDAVAQLSDEAIAAEKAKWPRSGDRVRERLGEHHSPCWLHTDRNSTHTAFADTCWIGEIGQMAMICEECAQKATTDATVIIAAGDKRKAYVASLPSPLAGLLP